MTAWPLIALLLAQHPHAHADAALEIASRPVPLRPGIGKAHDGVRTSAAAQSFYDQGLAYLHSFVWLEAARSFNQALRLDPQLATAHAMLSIAFTELGAPEEATQALRRATDLAPQASEHDRRHVDLCRLQTEAERVGRDSAALAAYRSALDAAIARFPHDEEFLLLRGLAESPDPAERGQGGVAASIPFYRRALASEPAHFAAHHYLAHAFENTGRVSDALTESAAYAGMAPAVPHARHMHGHSLRRAGRIDEAIAEFTAADDLETAYLRTEHVPAESDWHYQHNLDLLATSYQYVGRMGKAEALLKTSFGLASDSVEQEVNKREWPVFLLSRGRTQDALAAAKVMAAHRSPIVSAAGHVMAGNALLAMGDLRAAADEANAALRLMRSSPVGAGLVANSLQALQGTYLLRAGQREKGDAMLKDVASKMRAAPGPDAWTLALFVLEDLARASREAGDWELASWMAQQMLEHDAHYAGTHMELALVAEHRGDVTRARAERELAAKYWKNADPGLPEPGTVGRSRP